MHHEILHAAGVVWVPQVHRDGTRILGGAFVRIAIPRFRGAGWVRRFQ